MQYVGFWWRVLAYMIDGLILAVITVPIVGIFTTVAIGGAMTGLEGMDPNNPEANAMAAGAFLGGFMLMQLVMFLIFFLYEAVFTASKMMATPGKRMLGFAVLNAQTGERLGFGRALGRVLGKILSQMTMMIGFIMVAFTGRKQGLHDLVAGTVVVKRASLADINPVPQTTVQPQNNITQQM